VTEYELRELPPQTTAVIRARLPMAELPGLFERAFREVWALLEAQGIEATGPPFGFYPSMPGETVEVEAGFPVGRRIEPAGNVVPSGLRGGRVVKALHVGPYEALAETYEALQRWMGEQGLEPAGGPWECYLSDPSREPDPATWRTQIFWPVA
jgi:effector-binding domain-containing protein